MQPALTKRKLRQRQFQSARAEAKRSRARNDEITIATNVVATADPNGLMLGSKQTIIKSIQTGGSTEPLNRAGLTIPVAAAFRSLKPTGEDEVRALIDSGSSATIIRNKRFFKHLHPTSIKCADISGRVHNATGVGDIEVIVNTDDGPSKILLTGCLCIETFQADIISCSRLRDYEGYGFNLPPKRPGYMYLPNGKRATFERSSDRLEFLTLKLPDPTVTYKPVYANRTTTFSEWLEHASNDELHERIIDPPPTDNHRHTHKCRQRLAVQGIYAPKPQTAEIDPLVRLHLLGGHANSRVIAQYAKLYLTKEQRRQLQPIGRLFCDSCARTKSIRKARSKKPVQHTKPIAWSSMGVNVLGRFENASIVGQHRYCMVFVDRICNNTRCYPMKKLTEVPSTLNEHMQWVKTNHPKAYANVELDREQVLKLRSDSASYFLSTETEAVYAKHGVKHTASSSHTQSQNGAVERAIYSLTNSASAMRATAKLGPRYWCLALLHASDIHNHLPCATNDGVPPITAATGKAPNLHKFQIFGCKAYTTRPPGSRREGEHRAEVGLYMGHNDKSDTHKIIFPPSNEHNPHIGCFQLQSCRTTQPGALPPKMRQSTQSTIHVTFDTRTLPDSITSGGVPVVPDDYAPFHIDDEDLDYNQPIPQAQPAPNPTAQPVPPTPAATMPPNNGGPAESTTDFPLEAETGDSDEDDDIPSPLTDNPTEDRGSEMILDLDWHRTHALNEVHEFGTHPTDVLTQQECYAILSKRANSTPERFGHLPDIATSQTHRVYSTIQATRTEETDNLLGAIPHCCAISDTFSNKTKAEKSGYSHLVEAAKEKEMKQILDKNILEPTTIDKKPPGAKLFQSIMNFRLKRDENNVPTKLKARWCFGGHEMEEGIHYTDKSSFTPRFSTIRAHFAAAAQHGQRIKACDIEGAYLRPHNGPPLPPLYMRSPFD